MNTWLWIGGALLLGVVLGAAVSTWLTRRNGSDKETVNRLRGEIEDYKHEVSEHFVQTAELVNTLTRSYKAVYDHLEHGAYRLVGEESLRKELDNVDSEPVQLEYIGRRDGADVLGARPKRGPSRPAASTPGSAQAGVPRTGATQSASARADASNPAASQSGTSHTGAAQSGAAQTGTSQSGAAQSDAALSGTTRSNAAQPGAANVAAEESAVTETPADPSPAAHDEPEEPTPEPERPNAEEPKAAEPAGDDASSEDGKDPVR
ncbi:MAG: DUF1043 family protein [Trueperaceae bacterium]